MTPLSVRELTHAEKKRLFRAGFTDRRFERESVKALTGFPSELSGLDVKSADILPYALDSRRMIGAAPKDFVYLYEPGFGAYKNPRRWPSHIAKVGSKLYPSESI